MQTNNNVNNGMEFKRTHQTRMRVTKLIRMCTLSSLEQFLRIAA